MDEEIERLVVSVRADTRGFARDVAAMRSELEGPFGTAADQAGRLLDTALARALRNGKLGFDDLKRMALSAMAEIASSAIRSGMGALIGGGLGGTASQLFSSLLGLPGRATGGPVAPGRAYLVGERGPELFVPTASGRIDAGREDRARDVKLSIVVNAAPGSEPEALRQSSRQVARAVKRALVALED